MERAENIRAELLDGISWEELAEIESDDPASAGDGGQLGTLTRDSDDWPESFIEAVFSRPAGEIGEPLLTSRGIHLLEVLERDGDEAEARHILLSIDRSDEAELRLLTRADSLDAMAPNRTLDEIASEMGLEIHEGEIREDFAVLPGVGEAMEGRDWIFEDREPVGSVSPVFETRQAFYMLELTSRVRSGVLPLEEVSDEIRDRLVREKKVEQTLEEARAMRDELQDGSVDLDALAEREELRVESSGLFSRMDAVPGLGQRNAAIGAAFGTEPGSFAGPVRQGGQVILMEVTEKVEADREEFLAQKDILRQSMVAQLRQERLMQWLDGLRETTRIVDGRADFFRAVEEQDDQPQIPMAF
ncbi:MAG: hypothetical protein EA352_01460 [Gemmatimonadales bacterium]|nr:MAG: hypothetical protein EA352_01460 [Gemmatimonadales bacterium]